MMPEESKETLVCSSAIDCDEIAARLYERLESLSLDGPLAEALKNGELKSDGGNSSCELEIEVRFGVIKNINDGQRFSLPLKTDALVSQRAPVKFVAGVSESQYKAAHSYLKQVSNDSRLGLEWKSILGVSTIDRFFKLFDHQESWRISVPQRNGNSREKPLEAIRKVKLVTWNVSTAVANSEEHLLEEANMGDAGSDQLDYRIAINLEHKKRLHEMPTTSNATMSRRKERDSYIHEKGHLQFDLSQVQASNGSYSGDKGPESYEVEVELQGDTVLEILTNDSLSHNDRMVLLKYHCATLIRNVKHLRDVLTRETEWITAASIRPGILARHIGFSDLRFVQQKEGAIQRYMEYVSPQLPLIGDYLFREVAPLLEKTKYPGSDRSPYRDYVDAIPGPFVVMDCGPSQGKRVVLEEDANTYGGKHHPPSYRFH